MAFEATILADSASPAGHRLTTLQVTFPRFVLAEFNTHRIFSRNSASSRAIPVVKQLRRVLDEPFVPIEFGSNQPGMQAGPALVGNAHSLAEREWLLSRDDAVRRVLALISSPELVARSDDLSACLDEVEVGIKTGAQEDWLNVHKQVANRLLEPFMWHTVIVTATDWDNFFNLRCHPDAQPEIRHVADLMRAALKATKPQSVDYDDWHLPLVNDTDRAEIDDSEALVRISAGRCARVSYLTHAGVRDHGADIALYERLAGSGHMSPLEHPARPLSEAELSNGEWCGNFRGWMQLRKLIPCESDPLGNGPSYDEIVVGEDPRQAQREPATVP
jgi:thymidylate synthase ThyX